MKHAAKLAIINYLCKLVGCQYDLCFIGSKPCVFR